MGTFGDDFVIEKMSRRGARHGKKEFYCDNKVLRLRETFNLREFHGSRKTLYQIQDRKMRLRDSMAIEDGDGRKVAEIKKKVMGSSVITLSSRSGTIKIGKSTVRFWNTISPSRKIIVKLLKCTRNGLHPLRIVTLSTLIIPMMSP